MLNISNTNTNSLIIFSDNGNNNFNVFMSITEEELLDFVNKFRSKKSSDCNEFSMELKKNFFI